MKKILFILISFFTLTFSFLGCSDGGNDTNGSNGNGSGNGNGNSSALSLSKNELSFDSNNSYQTIKVSSTGEWEVTGGSDWCDISPCKGKTGETVTISVEANTTNEDRTVTYTFKCGNQTAKLTVLQHGIIETSYVDLKIDDKNTSIGYNEQTGETVIEYKSGTVPDAEIGQAFVLSGEHNYDIRKITGVTKSNGKLTLQTEQGNMCDLFKNVSFTLTTNPNIVASPRSAGRVITPTSIEIVNGNKRSVIFDKNSVSSRDVYENPIKIFDFNQDFSGVSLFMEDDGVSGEYKWEKWKANIGLDAVFHFDFGEKISNKTIIGELKNFKYYLQGNVDVDMLLALEAKAEAFSFSVPEEKQTVKKDILPVLSVKFMAGPVPVVITLETDLKREGEISCSGSINTSAGFKFHADAKLGMEYDVRTREAKPITEFNPQFELHKPTFDIQASLEATAGYYPHLQFHFYKFIGPYLDIKPLYTAGLQAAPFGKIDTFLWDAKFGTKITSEFGLELDWGLDNAELKLLDKDLYESTLFKAPASIKLESPEQGHQLRIGEEAEVCFHVQALNYLTDELYDCPGALVQIKTEATDKEEEEGGGRRSVVAEQSLVSDSKGRAKITWSPTKDNEYLIAEIPRMDGEATEKAEFRPKIKDERRTLLEMIYQQTNGENWTHHDNWLSERPINEWSGVRIDEESGKILLFLDNNNLTGTLKLDMTDESLKPLSNILKEINIEGNQLTKIELLGHESLEWIGCKRNPLELLDVSGCTALKELNIVCEWWGDTSTLTYLYAAACTSLEKINCSYNKLSTLFIEGCTALKELNCDSNELKELNISDFTKLEKLSCNWNPIIKLSISNCNALSEVFYDESSIESLTISKMNNLIILSTLFELPETLTSLKVSECTSLQGIGFENKGIKTLYLDGNTLLEQVDCSQNQLTNIQIYNCPSLKSLNCSQNQLTNIQIYNCPSLKSLNCSVNQLTELDISQCTSIEHLNCSFNLFTKIDFSNNKTLESIYWLGKFVEDVDLSGCSNLLYTSEIYYMSSSDRENNYPLKTANFSNCKSLKHLRLEGYSVYDDEGEFIQNSTLTSLNVSGCTALEYLSCRENKLTNLNISGCISLMELYCSYNQLTSLNISECSTTLYALSCAHNQISSVIPEWFKQQVSPFYHDQRYTDYWWEEIKDSEGRIIDEILHYTDNGIGWWYPGEPDKGYHGW